MDYGITDKKGRYKLHLQKELAYEISISFLGYESQELILTPQDTLKKYNFRLQESSTALDEVIITQEYNPVKIKKDTIAFDVKAFTNGDERKMKDALKKIPGVEVDKNGGVTVNGEKITQMLVENKSFFGGSTKLAVDNIPADALDSIEVLSNYTPTKFLKDVTDSDETVMNVKLKKDKKKFVFGDIEVAGGNRRSYKLHPALFYYTPKLNLGYIGDLNNVGESVMTYEDLIQFRGGASRMVKDKEGLSDLKDFVQDNDDVLRNKSQFSAINYGVEANDKLYVSGIGLFSKLYLQHKTVGQNEYLTDEIPFMEDKETHQDNQSLLGMFKLKLDYEKSEHENWKYTFQFQNSAHKNNTDLTSKALQDSTSVISNNQTDNLSFKHYIEWNKAFRKDLKNTLTINHNYENKKPQDLWTSNQVFLQNYLPWENDSLYTVNQDTRIKTHRLYGLNKFYWIINSHNHLYFTVGDDYRKTNFNQTAFQDITNGEKNSFAQEDFGNKMNYDFNDAYVKLEYKFMIGKLTNTAAVGFHYYTMKTHQIENNTSLSRFYVEPEWESTYEFSDSEKLKLKYSLENDFPKSELLNNRFEIRNYNAVSRGNALLKNERYHNASLRFTKLDYYSGLTLFAFLTLSKKTKAISQERVFDGINHFSIPVIGDNPTHQYNFMAAIQKKIAHFRLGFNTNLNWYNFTQSIDGVYSKNEINFQKIGAKIETDKKSWPTASLSYDKKFQQYTGLSSSKIQSDIFKAEFDYSFMSNFIVRADYEYSIEKNKTQKHTNHYQILNASLAYNFKESPVELNFSVQNILNNKSRYSQSISDFLKTETRYYVLPRIFLLGVTYQL